MHKLSATALPAETPIAIKVLVRTLARMAIVPVVIEALALDAPAVVLQVPAVVVIATAALTECEFEWTSRYF